MWLVHLDMQSTPCGRGQANCVCLIQLTIAGVTQSETFNAATTNVEGRIAYPPCMRIATLNLHTYKSTCGSAAGAGRGIVIRLDVLPMASGSVL